MDGGSVEPPDPLPLPPLQLVSQHVEERSTHSHQFNGMRRSPADEAVALQYRHPHLAVDAEKGLFFSSLYYQLDLSRVCHHERPVSQGVWAHRSNYKGIHRGHQDGPSGCQRIRRGPCRSGDDYAISLVVEHKDAVDQQVEINQSRDCALVNHNVVESKVPRNALFRTNQLRFEYGPLFQWAVPMINRFERRVHFCKRNLGQKTERTQVYRQDWHSRVSDNSCR